MQYYTSSTEFNCGIDLHARQMYVCLMDPPQRHVRKKLEPWPGLHSGTRQPPAHCVDSPWVD